MKEITNLWDAACNHRVFEKNGNKFTLLKILDDTLSEEKLFNKVERILDDCK